MLSLEQLQQIITLANNSLSLGGFYKNSVIPLNLQPIIKRISNQVLSAKSIGEVSLSLDEIQSLEEFFYNQKPPLNKFNNAAYTTILKKKVLTKADIWLPSIRPNVYSLAVYPLIMKESVAIGQLYELFTIQNESAKGVVKEVNLQTNEVIITPHSSLSSFTKARFHNWWLPVKQMSEWVDYSCFIDKENTNSFFAVHSNFPSDYKLSSVRWSFYYNDAVIAKGVDSITPGLCSLSIANKVFKPGTYTIKAKRMLNSVSAAKQDSKQVELTLYNSSIVFDSFTLI